MVVAVQSECPSHVIRPPQMNVDELNTQLPALSNVHRRLQWYYTPYTKVLIWLDASIVQDLCGTSLRLPRRMQRCCCATRRRRRLPGAGTSPRGIHSTIIWLGREVPLTHFYAEAPSYAWKGGALTHFYAVPLGVVRRTSRHVWIRASRLWWIAEPHTINATSTQKWRCLFPKAWLPML